VSQQIPLVDYLVLEPDPHLVANECTQCGARYFDRRNACASCGQHAADGTGWRQAPVSTTGELTTFTIVSFAAPGVPVPFVAGVIDCDGTSVRGNVVGVEPDAEHVRTGMEVRLTTFPIGEDAEGTEAIGFGFEPIHDDPNQGA
jgi:uncharacterized OB-fold protein